MKTKAEAMEVQRRDSVIRAIELKCLEAERLILNAHFPGKEANAAMVLAAMSESAESRAALPFPKSEAIKALRCLLGAVDAVREAEATRSLPTDLDHDLGALRRARAS
jgi:hypothetical protein